MKRIMLILLASALLAPSLAKADYLPAGCYVADYERTDPCWGEDLAYFNWFDANFANVDSDNAYYGLAISTFINQETIYRLNYDKAAKDLKKQKDLVKKLKKKCGSNCRSIR